MSRVCSSFKIVTFFMVIAILKDGYQFEFDVNLLC